MFRASGYSNWFLHKSVEKFLKIKVPRVKRQSKCERRKLFFGIPYFGKSSQLFTKQLSKLTANLITVKLIPIRTKRLKLAIISIEITYSYAFAVQCCLLFCFSCPR